MYVLGNGRLQPARHRALIPDKVCKRDPLEERLQDVVQCLPECAERAVLGVDAVSYLSGMAGTEVPGEDRAAERLEDIPNGDLLGRLGEPVAPTPPLPPPPIDPLDRENV